jgi:hypothetical protein
MGTSEEKLPWQKALSQHVKSAALDSSKVSVVLDGQFD